MNAISQFQSIHHDNGHVLLAEQALLGILMFENSAHALIFERLRPEFFFEPFHQKLYAVIADEIERGRVAEPIALTSKVCSDRAFSELGGLSYLADLVERAPPTSNVVGYARVVQEDYTRRSIEALGSEMAGELSRGAPVSQVLALGRSAIERLDSIGEPGKSRFDVVNFHDLKPEPLAWLIKGALPMRGVGFIGGATKAGKSFLTLDTTLRLAAGAPKVLNRKARRAGIVYIAAEDPEGCKYRVKAWEKKHHRSSQMPFDLIPQAVNLFDDGAMQELRKALNTSAARFKAQGTRLGVIVFDTLSRCLSGADENSSADMGRAFAILAELARITGALVLVVAHFGKSGSEKGIRGWSGLDANSDATISVERSADDPDLRIVTLAKVKNGVDGGQLGFRLEEIGLGMTDDDGDEIVSCVPVFEPVSDTPLKQKRAKALSAPEELVLSAVRHVHDNGPNRPMPDFIEGKKPWQKALTKADAKARALVSGFADNADKPDAVRMRFNRALEALVAARKVRIEGELVWLL